MKGEYVTQKENLIWEGVQTYFSLKKNFFCQKGLLKLLTLKTIQAW